jgi:hypothetical protein
LTKASKSHNNGYVKRVASAALVSAALLAPKIAEACPQCAANDKGGIGVGVLLGALILLPYPIVWFVVRLINKASESERVDRPSPKAKHEAS